jgi:DNA primase
MNVENSLWICHGCGARGTPVDFLVKFYGHSDSEALRVLTERYGGAQRTAINGLVAEVQRILHPPEVVDDRSVPDESWVAKFCQGIIWDDITAGRHSFPPGEYMLERGFAPEMLDLWQIGYDDISGRVTIPVRDVDGKLVGFKGRDWTGERQPKYLIIGDGGNRESRYGFDTYRKSEHVFGLGTTRGSDLIIVEGELNVIAMWQHGFTNAVGVAGSEFSTTQCRLITRYASTATVFFDADEAGYKGALKVVDMLAPLIPVRVASCSDGDAAEITTEQATEALKRATSSLTLRLRSQGLAV